MQFHVSEVERPSDRLLQVTGELDVATVSELAVAVAEALEHEPARLLVDLTPTRFLDSTGCRELIRTAKEGGARGVAVEVVAPPDNWRVRRVVDFVQLSHLLVVHDELPAP